MSLLGDQVREKRTGTRTPRYVERFVREPVRRTMADSKIFRRDPQYPARQLDVRTTVPQRACG